MMYYLVQNKVWFVVIAFVIFGLVGCKAVEVSNEVTSCGKNDDKVDCTQLEGWESGRCEHGVCVPTACKKYSYLLKTEAGGLFSRDVVRCDPVWKGDIIKFGKYEQDGDDANGKEDIEWRVLARDGSKVLLISDKTLDAKRYNENNIYITWEKSTIRSWLNGYDSSFNEDGIDYRRNNFLKMAFSKEEQAKIANTRVHAHFNPKYGTSTGNAVNDKIFLLSIVEANNYFTSDKDRNATTTQYAISKMNNYTQVMNQWWLRTSGSFGNFAAFVNYDGYVNNYGYYVDSNYVAVRPALWLRILESEAFQTRSY